MDKHTKYITLLAKIKKLTQKYTQRKQELHLIENNLKELREQLQKYTSVSVYDTMYDYDHGKM